MFETIKILDKSEKVQFFFLAFLVFLSVLVELLSLGLILPVTSYIFSENSEVNNYIRSFTQFQDMDKKTIINILLLILLSAFFVKNLFLSYFYYYENSYLYKTTQNISAKLYKIILYKSINYHIHKHSSEIVNNLTKETSMFGAYLTALILLITEVPILLGICLFLFFIEPIGFSIICSISIFFGSIYFFLTKKKISKIGYTRKNLEQKKVQYLQEAIDGIKEIKIYKQENFFLKKFTETSQRIAKMYYIFGFLTKLPRLFYEFLFVILVVIVIFYFNYQNSKPADFIPFLSVLLVASLRVLPSLNRIVGATQQLNYTKFSRDTIFFEIKNSFHNSKENFCPKLKKSINFKNVYFQFNDKQGHVIKNFSHDISKGDIVSILGTTGVGKSTLLNIFSGLLKPTSGEIYMDGKKINYLTENWLDQISYVPQSVFLFDDTIEQNIIFDTSEKKIDPKKFKEVIEISQLGSLIEKLPEGVQTRIGDEGKKLSGGEKQRLGIARALYKNTDILIFDEATSALDEKTERSLFESLIKYLDSDKIFLFVTHKKSMSNYANKLINL